LLHSCDDEGWRWADYRSKKIEIDRHDIDKLGVQINEETKIVENLREALKRLWLKRKAIESLKDRRRREFRKEVTRKDQKAIDEASR